jgi:hypothetical protein
MGAKLDKDPHPSITGVIATLSRWDREREPEGAKKERMKMDSRLRGNDGV